MLAVRTKPKALLAVRWPSILATFVGGLAVSVAPVEEPTLAAPSGVLRAPATPFVGFRGVLSQASGSVDLPGGIGA